VTNKIPDDALIHVVDWSNYVRYANHARNDSWRPPLVSLEVGRMLDLSQDFTPTFFAVFTLIVLDYANAPLFEPGSGPQGPRRLPLRRLHASVTAAGWAKNVRLTSVIEACLDRRLLALSTIDGLPLERPGADSKRSEEDSDSKGSELEEDSDSKWTRTRRSLDSNGNGHRDEKDFEAFVEMTMEQPGLEDVEVTEEVRANLRSAFDYERGARSGEW
jgi:hypothetical protein